MRFAKLVKAGDNNYMHTSDAWLNDVKRFNLTDCYILDIQDDVTDDMVIAELDAKELTLTDEDTVTWMGEYGGYRFYSCGGTVHVWQHTDGTHWCAEQEADYFFAF
jgi:hypothetical protein